MPTWVGKVSWRWMWTNAEDTPGYAWELFYKFQVTDNITVTPADDLADASPTPTIADDNDNVDAVQWPHQDHFQVLISLVLSSLLGTHLFSDVSTLHASAGSFFLAT